MKKFFKNLFAVPDPVNCYEVPLCKDKVMVSQQALSDAGDKVVPNRYMTIGVVVACAVGAVIGAIIAHD